MKTKFMSLANFFKSQKEDENDKDPDAADKKKAPAKDDKKKDDDESGDGDDDQTDEEKKDKKKKSETDETKADEESGEGKSASVNSVTLALDDFNQLMALASTAKSVSAENTKLKAKADEWDNYQAALSGGKADSDTASGGKKSDNSGKSAIDLLREKHGAALVD